jgi:hypothetical protein
MIKTCLQWEGIMDDWAKVSLGGIIGAVGVAGAGWATGYYSLASKNEELHVHLVEIAFGILEAEPKQGVAPARGWAIEVIERNSGVKFSNEDREALLSKPIASKDLSSWKSKDWAIFPYNGDFKDFFKKLQEEKNNTTPSK